jgi:uncharacterized protein (DUF1778 family)
MKRQNPIMVRLTAEEKEKLQREAKKEKTNVSDLIRRRALNGLTLKSIDDRLKTIESSLQTSSR